MRTNNTRKPIPAALSPNPSAARQNSCADRLAGHHCRHVPGLSQTPYFRVYHLAEHPLSSSAVRCRYIPTAPIAWRTLVGRQAPYQ
ncbi:hypothetical protein DEO72_LG11g2244 [Vigna unguiculata]|uniref:Uncharacterized protein n=1 Tax=Vigna unguiculata TaxID=3917 RepID=A0A4D6NSK2_VIGUN|nr:hypothetical protein DEO72_LG11g2244 [Vigna unguiculata]